MQLVHQHTQGLYASVAQVLPVSSVTGISMTVRVIPVRMVAFVWMASICIGK